MSLLKIDRIDSRATSLVTFLKELVAPKVTTNIIAVDQIDKRTGANPTFLTSPLAPTPSLGDNSTKVATTSFVNTAIKTYDASVGVYGLIYNQTADTYKRFGTGTTEDNQFLSTLAGRLNDNSNSDPVTSFFNKSTTVQGNMKRVVLSNAGTYVKDYNATSYAHIDQTGLTATQTVMVNIPKFYYINVDFAYAGAVYTIIAQSLNPFNIDLSTMGFIGATSIVGQNATGYTSYASISGTVITAIIHSAFSHYDGSIRNNMYLGAFKSFNNATNYRSTCTTVGTSTPVKATASVTIAAFRAGHIAFGSNFNTYNYLMRDALNLTVLIERGTYQTEVNGATVGTKWEGYSWNTAAVADDQNLGLTLAFTNTTGCIRNGSNQTIANTYRGIEGYHSHLWEFVDGVNIISSVVWLAKHGSVYLSDTTSSPYFTSGRTTLTSGAAVYTSTLFAGTSIPATATGASSTTKITDAGWYATGNTVLVVGGACDAPGISGVFTWASYGSSSAALWLYGSRFAALV